MSWTPFCSRRPGYEHAVQCADQISCTNCGQANPDFVIDLVDSPPQNNASAVPVTYALQISKPPTFHNEHRATVIANREEAIQKTKSTISLPHAGRSLHGNQQAGHIIPNHRSQVAVQVHLWQAEVKNKRFRTYHKWESSGSTRMDLLTDSICHSKDEFLDMITINLDLWQHIVSKGQIEEIMIAGSMDKNGPVGLLSQAVWKEGHSMRTVLQRFFTSTIHKSKTEWSIHICVGRQSDDDQDDIDIPLLKTTSKNKNTSASKRDESVKIKIEQSDSLSPSLRLQAVKGGKKAGKGPLAKKRSFSDFQFSPDRITEERNKDDQGFENENLSVSEDPAMVAFLGKSDDEETEQELDAPAARTRKRKQEKA